MHEILQGGLAQLARAPALQAGGQRFESVILHPSVRLDTRGKRQRSLTYWTNETKSKSRKDEIKIHQIKTKLKVYQPTTDCEKKQSIIKSRAKVDKGTWRMPRLSQAKKDVISCEKLRVDANNPRSADFRMGQPNRLKTCYPYNYGGKRRQLKHLSSGRKRK